MTRVCVTPNECRQQQCQGCGYVGPRCQREVNQSVRFTAWLCMFCFFKRLDREGAAWLGVVW